MSDNRKNTGNSYPAYARCAYWLLCAALVLIAPTISIAEENSQENQIASSPAQDRSKALALTAKGVSGGSDVFTSHATALITVGLTCSGTPVNDETITWRILSVDNSPNQAVMHTDARGLAWGNEKTATPKVPLKSPATSVTDSSGVTSIQLSDILGERTVIVRANIGSDTGAGVNISLSFGKGPLAVFKAPKENKTYQWTPGYIVTPETTTFPAMDICDGKISYKGNGYYRSSNLPTINQLRLVSGRGNSAWLAAGWPGMSYWSGELAREGNDAYFVNRPGYGLDTAVYNTHSVICLRDE